MVVPSFEYAKPPILSTTPDVEWHTFHSKIQGAVRNMWSERPQFLAFFALLPIFVVLGVLPIVLPIEFPRFVMVPVGIFILGGIFGMRFYAVQKNNVHDATVMQACIDFAAKTGLSVEYRTQWTGFCKPKHARPYRAIAIGPSGGGIGSTADANVIVTVPEGAGPGTTLQVQAPKGQTIQVTVPDGIFAGQTFQAQVAPTPVVVATPVNVA